MTKIQSKSKPTLDNKKTKKKSDFIVNLSLSGINYLIFGIGILAIVLGYIVMATGKTYSFQSLTISPIILLIGYLILIPIAILYTKKDHSEKSNQK